MSPNTTATLTPAVEAACETGIPVIVFDRGVNTDCPVTFIKPIGGYAFGADAAEFLVDEVEPAARCSPCASCPASTCSRPASPARSRSSRTTASSWSAPSSPRATRRPPSRSWPTTSRVRASSTASGWTPGPPPWPPSRRSRTPGVDVPPITGEDQQDFLQKWDEDGLTAVAPTYPTYQWRTPVIAAVRILTGEQVPEEWNLPQPKITEDNLADYLQPDMGAAALRPVRVRGHARLPGELAVAGPACRGVGESWPPIPGMTARTRAMTRTAALRRQHLDLGVAADRRPARRCWRRASPGGASTWSSCRSRTPATGTRPAPRRPARRPRPRRHRVRGDAAGPRAGGRRRPTSSPPPRTTCGAASTPRRPSARAWWPGRCTPRWGAPGGSDARRAGRLAVELREALAPVAEYAAARGVRLGVEPLNRYETSVVNTVEQGLEMLDGLPAEAVGLALDTYHLNIEEQDPAAAVRPAGAAGRLAHVQVCANDRGAPGADHMDWPAPAGRAGGGGVRRAAVHRVVHGRERVDRHRRLDLAAPGPLAGRHRHRRPGVPALASGPEHPSGRRPVVAPRPTLQRQRPRAAPPLSARSNVRGRGWLLSNQFGPRARGAAHPGRWPRHTGITPMACRRADPQAGRGRPHVPGPPSADPREVPCARHLRRSPCSLRPRPRHSRSSAGRRDGSGTTRRPPRPPRARSGRPPRPRPAAMTTTAIRAPAGRAIRATSRRCGH